MKNRFLILGLSILGALLIFDTGYLIGRGEQIEQAKRTLEKRRSFFVCAMTSKETDRAIIMTINLPGLDKKDINLEVRGRYLTIQVKKSKETNFVQIITLPQDIKAQKISAEYDEDTLRITIPKAKAANTKALSVIKVPLR
ncbi:MAG: Hsp20/alpha crystallin family protein [Candidatus Omnitrophica bacterium]|nr:Hsp20/alpha crystallin family protein [Candidatus Omnitrophota bacterium]